MPDLPIAAVLPALRQALAGATGAVLQAPPGAGKTTRVPLDLLEAPWLAGQKIVMLEPRRLAARAAAHRMAQTLGERVGQTVGYRVRMDTKVGPKTRIEVVTEGVLTRILQSDPGLEGIGLVIFDEYHERSLQADLGLALCLEAQEALRPDLRLLVMSATLAGAPVADLLGGVPVVSSEGRSFPVETHYHRERRDDRIEQQTARAVRRALAQEDGDVLVFLPGVGEIRRVETLLAEDLPADVTVHPLYGNLSHQAQDDAIAPSPAGRRKVVLATSIAETSLTIEGIRVVVDSGLMRVPRFSPRSGMTRLETITVSKASADQRRGRAGRLGPGVCYRLWTRHAQHHLVPFAAPEIAEADLAPLALELACWGTDDPAALRWLDAPPAAAYAQARDLLTRLGALDAEGRVTPHGRQMNTLPLHPRLSHMMLRADALGHGALACDVAALLNERDIFRGREGPPSVDLRLRLEALRAVRRGRRSAQAFAPGMQVDHGACRRAIQLADTWRRSLDDAREEPDVEACGLVLALAYPDRIGQQRRTPEGEPQEGRYRLSSGRAAIITEPQLVANAPYLVAADVDGRAAESRIFLAAPVAQADLEQVFAAQIADDIGVDWDVAARRVRARRQRRLGALVLKETPVQQPDAEAVVDALLAGVRDEGPRIFDWSKKARGLQERLLFLHRHDPEAWPDVSDEALWATLDDWLRPHLYGLRRADDLQRLDLVQLLLGRLAWDQRQALDARAPTHYEVPSGSRIRIDYSDPAAPVLAVRLQEMFGLTETPRVDGGRVPLMLHLLSPAQRPVQVTQDLASFWATGYFDVKKDMKGRYPKHYWPDDPLAATPTNRVRPKK